MTPAQVQLMLELLTKANEYSNQLHPENTDREQKNIERRFKKTLESMCEYLAVMTEPPSGGYGNGTDSKTI
jgi:hypothetical protein